MLLAAVWLPLLARCRVGAIGVGRVPEGIFAAAPGLTGPAPTLSRRAMPLPLGFIPPCLPTKSPQPPTGDTWVHEIKHDGFRVIARKDGECVRLYSRPGNDLTHRFPLIVEALARLRSRSCII